MPDKTVTRSFRISEGAFLALEEEAKKRNNFELDPADTEAIAALDKKVSSFFDHRNPEEVRRLSGVRLDI